MIARPKSLLEQVVNWLREGAQAGHWSAGLPGLGTLARESGVAEGTMRRAVRLLEKEGVFSYAGAGRRRQVVMGQANEKAKPTRQLRVAVLLRDDLANESAGFRWIMATVQSQIEAMGHRMVLLKKTQADFQFNDSRVIRVLRRETADLWIVVGGSRMLLEWFTAQGRRTFAFGGGCVGMTEVAATGSETQPTHLATLGKLCALGHRRIVFLMPYFVRHVAGAQSSTARRIMEELAAHGISGGAYHLPDFEETPEGLRERLDALFRVTPPTAIFATYPGWAFGVLSYLAARGLKVPEDVSVVCGNDASGFAWTQPRVAHYQHDDGRMARRIVKWVEHWAQGRRDFKQVFAPARLIEEGSIGPVKG
jgi:DNA-binding LacI/PurR family transcriptional regulator